VTFDSSGIIVPKNGGFLRPSVSVRRFGDIWQIRHSIWELDIPSQVVNENEGFAKFLGREVPISFIKPLNRASANLLSLLVAQGCVTVDGHQPSYNLNEVRKIVAACAAQWYGIYYSHPFWTEFESEDLSKTKLFGWMLRTYHLSRSVGPTAARGALYSPLPHVRRTFLKSAIEEYSHCEIYYFPEHQIFNLDSEWIRGLVPTPAATAFDKQMAIIAEDDWLAHTIVALFQEYTGAFGENALATYARLEKKFGLGGFFNGWKDHIGYDTDHSHADDLDELFRGEYVVSAQNLTQSLDAAANTISHLVWALDELSNLSKDANIRTFRVGPELMKLGATSSSLLGGIDDISGICKSKNLSVLRTRITNEFQKNSLTNDELFVLSEALHPKHLTPLVTRALSHAVRQDEAVGLGDLLQYLIKIQPDCDPQIHEKCSKGARVILNYLREQCGSPARIPFLLSVAADIIGGYPNYNTEFFASIRKIANRQIVTFDNDSASMLTYLTLEFSDLIFGSIKMPNNEVTVDCFS